MSKSTRPAAELEIPSQETLTDSSAEEVRTLLEQNEGNRTRIVGLRDAQTRKIDDANREIASLDRLVDLLDTTGDHYRAQLNQPPHVLSLQVVQEQAEVSEADHRSVWDGTEAPQTGAFATVPDLSPDPEKNMANLVEQWEAQAEREGAKR